MSSLPLEFVRALITDPHEADQQCGHSSEKGQEDSDEVEVFIEDLYGAGRARGREGLFSTTK